MPQKEWPRFGFENLLIWLFLYILVGPFLSSLQYAKFILLVILSAVLFSAIYAVKKQLLLKYIAFPLLVFGLLLHLLEAIGLWEHSGFLRYSITIFYLAILAYSFVGVIFRATRVTTSLICATLCLYLIIGVLWGALYALAEEVLPGSFNGALLDNANNASMQLQVFTYFSFVTITTLGYGDILPQTPGATALCQAQAVVGQFFIAVLVARLVGLEVSQNTRQLEE